MQRDGDQPASCGMAIMAKASRAGLTKTRLSPPLSLEDAALCNTAFLKDMADNLLSACAEASLAGYVAFGPAGAERFFHTHLPAQIELLEIWDADLGLCLQRTLHELFARGHETAGVLNSDSPTLPSAFLVEAARVLAAPGDRIVFGPCTDGGYYFLGCKRVHTRLFEEIAWSTDAVARQTLDRATELGLSVHMLPLWYDVDDAASLHTVTGELLNGSPFHPRIASSRAHNTTELMRRLIAEDLLGAQSAASPSPSWSRWPSLPQVG